MPDTRTDLLDKRQNGENVVCFFGSAGRSGMSEIEMTTMIQSTCKVAEHADPRVRRTRKLLQDAFRSLIREKRFSDISVQDITERATVNRATFYAHYVDKSDLGMSVMKSDMVTVVMQLFAQRPSFTKENLLVFSIAMFEFVGGVHERCPNAAADLTGSLSMGIEDELYSLVRDWVAHSNAYAKMFPGCSRDAVASVISSSIFSAAHRWVRTSRRESAEDVCRNIVAVLVRE